MEAVIESIRPFFTLCRIFGSFSFSIDKHGAKLSKTHAILVVATWITFFSLRYQYLYANKLEGGTFSSINLRISTHLAVAMFSSSFFINLLLRNEFFEILKILTKFDSKMMKLGARVDHRSHRKFTKAAIIIVLLHFVVQLLVTIPIPTKFKMKMTHFATPAKSLETLLMMIAGNAMNGYGVLFALIVLGIRARIKIFNKHLKHVNRNAKTFSQLHDDLNRAMQKISKIFAFPVMVGFSLCTMQSCSALYEFSSVVLSPGASRQQLGFCIFSNWWNFYNTIYFVVVITCCSLTDGEGKKGVGVVYKMMRKEPGSVGMLAMQLKHSPLEISCGLFVFDWSVLLHVSDDEHFFQN
jgi:hypothetical protein